MNSIFSQISFSSKLNTSQSQLLRLVEGTLQQIIQLPRLFSNKELVEENRILRKQVVQLEQDLQQKMVRLQTMEKQYIQYQKQQEQIQIGLHEIKSPLTAIIGFAGLLLENHSQKEKSKQKESCNLELIHRIHQAGKRQLEILQSLLRGTQEQEVNYQMIPLEKMLNEISTNTQILSKQKNLHFETWIHPSAPQKLYTDEKKLHCILNNLLANALKYTDEGGIKLEVIGIENEISFIISDTGKGITYDEQQKILQFLQKGANTSQANEYGIGLMIAVQMTNLLQGSLEVSSDGMNKGSTFTLNLTANSLENPSKDVLYA